VSAAELLYGSPLTLPGQFLSTAEPSLTDFLQQQQLGMPCFSPRQGPEPQEDARVCVCESAAAGAIIVTSVQRFLQGG
jgi:hypothetical protein